MSFLKKLFGKGDPAEGASPLVKDLIGDDMSARQAALGRVLNMGNREALDAVEEAIRRLTGKKEIDFYRPGGMRMGSPQDAYNQVVELARKGKMGDDPAHVQSLIPGVAFMNQQLMQELGRIDKKALTLYQLLGVQMQLKMKVG